MADARTIYPISTINEAGIKTEQLELINADWSKELAKDSIKNLFLKYDGKIEAIIANNDAMAIGAIEALQQYGYNKGDKSKFITIVGIDGLPEAKELIDKGFMAGTVIQDSKALAHAYYVIGINLVNGLDPTKNTDYTFKEGVIEIPLPYNEYTKASK